MSNNRQRGDYFERQTRAALADAGWLVVRSAGSLGIADVVALRASNTPLLVSCKLNGRIDPAEREALAAAAQQAGARALVASREARGWVTMRTVGTRHIVDTLKVPSRGRVYVPDRHGAGQLGGLGADHDTADV
jgi:Holliday junction resolvase